MCTGDRSPIHPYILLLAQAVRGFKEALEECDLAGEYAEQELGKRREKLLQWRWTCTKSRSLTLEMVVRF